MPIFVLCHSFNIWQLRVNVLLDMVPASARLKLLEMPGAPGGARGTSSSHSSTASLIARNLDSSLVNLVPPVKEPRSRQL
jgi:hypothetical protein